MSGRGWGKTRAGSEWLLAEAISRPGTDWAVVAPTFGAARDVCAEGTAGILRIAQRDEVAHYVRSLGEIRLRNGSRIYARSADEHDRLRGLNLAGAWCDELAVWRDLDAAWNASLMPAVRHDPGKIVITTTPRPVPLLKDLLGRDDGSVAVSRGSTFDNAPNLSRSALAELRARYEHTRLGRQELGGELLEDVEGALWSLELIEEYRTNVTDVPDLDRVVVGVDPAVTSRRSSDETGIVTCGISGHGSESQFFVLADDSGRMTPQRWASSVAKVYARERADRVVAEVNQGGDLVEQTLRAATVNLPMHKVHATRGKALRAEPIVALYEQGHVHHVGLHAQLEEQLTTWVPDVGRSPDGLDALVYALTELSAGSGKGARLRYRPREPPPSQVDRWPERYDPMIASSLPRGSYR
jgi:phage terminase large subunit-like protein